MPVISPSFVDMNKELHGRNQHYGAGGHKHLQTIEHLAKVFKVKGILDYGCGKMTLAQEMGKRGWRVMNYDPAIPGVDNTPEPVDLVVCTDVMEHIEPECLDDVMADLKRVTKRILFTSISCTPAFKSYEDGQNVHVCQMGASTWLRLFLSHFDAMSFNVSDHFNECTGIWVPRGMLSKPVWIKQFEGQYAGSQPLEPSDYIHL